MNPGQERSRTRTRDAQLRVHSSPQPQRPDAAPADPELLSRERPVGVDEDVLSPQVRELLHQGSGSTGLEVDRGGGEEEEDGDEDDDGDDDGEADNTRSIYAMSLYPGVQPAYQVEHPYETGQDSATMCVAPPVVQPR